MACICYPFHVKHAGRDYAPGEPIIVADAAPYIPHGAMEIPEPEENIHKLPRKKTANPKQET